MAWFPTPPPPAFAFFGADVSAQLLADELAVETRLTALAPEPALFFGPEKMLGSNRSSKNFVSSASGIG